MECIMIYDAACKMKAGDTSMHVRWRAGTRMRTACATPHDYIYYLECIMKYGDISSYDDMAGSVPVHGRAWSVLHESGAGTYV